MKINPFTSSTFETIWSKHFNRCKTPMSFDFISGVKFFKHSFLPLYENIGANLTKGIFYKIDYSKSDYKGKTFLIYDVPHYFDVDEFNAPSDSSLKLKTVFQYQGFLMNLSSFENQDDYINAQFSSKNRREFRANMRKLETCFNIEYSFIHGEISQAEFDTLFNQFYELLSKRFDGKQVNYHHLNSDKWNFYTELVYAMLKEKRASLLVIYRDKTPIGVTLNFHSEDVLFETITVFDPDYYKFSIGKTSIIKLLEWCFENNYRISDFSKGDFDYKHKWGNLDYDFDYHILYDSKSIVSLLTANYIEAYFKLKLFLRRKKVNELYRKYKFMLTSIKDDEKLPENNAIKFEKLDDVQALSSKYIEIDYTADSYAFLKQYVYTFSFANPESIANIKVYKHSENDKVVVISGSKKAQRITFQESV